MIISGAILLMAIDGYYIGGYFRLNYHILLVAIGGHSIVIFLNI
jgi:hypothetical protein